MVDYPNHLARMYILSASGTPDANPFYRTAWALYPNLAMDLIIPQMARLIDVETATRLFLLLEPAPGRRRRAGARTGGERPRADLGLCGRHVSVLPAVRLGLCEFRIRSGRSAMGHRRRVVGAGQVLAGSSRRQHDICRRAVCGAFLRARHLRRDARHLRAVARLGTGRLSATPRCGWPCSPFRRWFCSSS